MSPVPFSIPRRRPSHARLPHARTLIPAFPPPPSPSLPLPLVPRAVPPELVADINARYGEVYSAARDAFFLKVGLSEDDVTFIANKYMVRHPQP